MRILFNADDYGLTKGINAGIIKAHRDGLVGAATMMMNGLAIEDGVRLAKENPGLDIGIHLVLTYGKPISEEGQALTDEHGDFRYTNRFAEMEVPDLEMVYAEWKAQIEKFLTLGLPLHHIDSHHHVHGWEPLKDVVIRLVEEYGTKVRAVPSLSHRSDLFLTSHFTDRFYGEGVTFETLETLPDVDSLEVMTHPAFVDADLEAISSYTTLREQEIEVLTTFRPLENWELL